MFKKPFQNICVCYCTFWRNNFFKVHIPPFYGLPVVVFIIQNSLNIINIIGRTKKPLLKRVVSKQWYLFYDFTFMNLPARMRMPALRAIATNLLNAIPASKTKFLFYYVFLCHITELYFGFAQPSHVILALLSRIAKLSNTAWHSVHD